MTPPKRRVEASPDRKKVVDLSKHSIGLLKILQPKIPFYKKHLIPMELRYLGPYFEPVYDSDGNQLDEIEKDAEEYFCPECELGEN